MPDASNFALVLEFELPRSGGRRPDLIVLENGLVLVIEFKNRVTAEAADLAQVKGYVRDLEDYHAACRGKTLVPILVPIGMEGEPEERDGVRVVPSRLLGRVIREISKGGEGKRGDGEAFVLAPFEPLPALVDAARLLFERKPLPRIRAAESARIPATVARLERLAREVRGTGRRSLALVSGVPGSGKTLVGLQLVHSRDLGVPAVFLSGNGPLVNVLQYVLENKEFVRDMKKFIHDHLVRTTSAPREHVVVFDEAQRAWDRDRVLKKHRGALADGEPALLARIATKVSDGFVLVALIGTGQEIHEGEEGGIAQWVGALKEVGGWDVLGPPGYREEFVKAGIEYTADDLLHLTVALRSHRASDTALWAGLLLEGRLTEAASVAAGMRDNNFEILGSRSLNALRDYARERYSNESGKRFGLVTSSRFRNIDEYGVRTPPAKFFPHGPWYESHRDDPKSCCRLEVAETEFGCQGLELDFPIVCWGPDLVWRGAHWEVVIKRRNPDVRNPAKLRLNAYRVLLTRGRDGMAVFVPPGQAGDATWSALLAGGIRELA
ncbi:MAG: DNA/RNA helicase domain-containing protein [Planctomycetota bacterium]